MLEFNKDQILEKFPFKNPRAGQIEITSRILDSFAEGYKFVFADCPTGSGKSAIAFTVAQMVESAYYLAPQKFLQDQLVTDFGEEGRHLGSLSPMIDLKGRNSYPCPYWDRALGDSGFNWGSEPEVKKATYLSYAQKKYGCDHGQCKMEGKSKLDYCIEEDAFCPYYLRVCEALDAKICLMNYHSFLFQTSFSPNFGKRELLILDEAHQTEDVLLKFVEFRISDRFFQTFGIRFPKLNTVEDYIKYFEEIDLTDKIRRKIAQAIMELDTKAQDDWENAQLKYQMLQKSNPEEWVCIWEEPKSGVHRTITLKPIFINSFAQKYIFDKAEFILMMSATILSRREMCEALGIEAKTKHFKMDSTFPAKNRPLLYEPSGPMSFKKKAETLPKLVKDVNRICRLYENERGIIHTHSFDIMNAILADCDLDVRYRLLHQLNPEFGGNKHALLKKHASDTNSVIIAPAMHEGLDLVDDLARFQVICKVPYPSKGDPQIAARMELSRGYYNWKTACKLIQSYGRIYRHKEDFGKTYILDEDFKRFCRISKHMLPKWFWEAIVWDD